MRERRTDGRGVTASLLFIGPSCIGDIVVSTGALEYAISQLGEPRVTIASGPLAKPLLRAIPNLAAIHSIRKKPFAGHWFDLLKELEGQRFDLAIDLRGTLTTIPIARRRIIYRRTPAIRAKVEEFSAMMGSSSSLPPKLRLDQKAREDAHAAFDGAAQPFVAIAPGGDYLPKCWPTENFVALARRLVSAGGAIAGGAVVLRCGPGDAGVAAEIAEALTRAGVRAVDLTEKMDLLAYAAVLEQAALFVGNDSGPMHIAAAMGAPTLGLFGPTDERLYAPWGPRALALRGRPFAELAAHGAPDLRARSLMDDISVDMAEGAARDLLRGGGLG